ncbi:glycosyltransferase [Chloroflexota bacterium]
MSKPLIFEEGRIAMKTSTPLATVVIPTYNRASSLRRALQSVVNLNLSPEQYEVVVVDNNSTDDTPKVVQAFLDRGLPFQCVVEIRLSFTQFARMPPSLLGGGMASGGLGAAAPIENLPADNAPQLAAGWFTAARHAGAEAARGRILSYIDDDVVVDGEWLTAVIDAFQGDEAVGIVGGPILPMFEVELPGWIKQYYPMSGWLSLMDRGSQLHETDHAYGPNSSVRKDVLQAVGGFPADTIGVEAEGRPGVVEKPYVGSGDVGLCSRVTQAGYKVMYAPGALVHHVIPPVRLTKEWWHSRLAGEGCYHALTQQYVNEESRATLFRRGLQSTWRAAKTAIRYAGSGMKRTGRERHEFWISYHLSRARVEFALAGRPELARQLWEVAVTGVPPEDIDELVRLLP